MRTKEQQQAYDEGYAAYANGDTIKDCPYRQYLTQDISLSSAWIDGWEMAYDDHQEHMDSISPLKEEDY